MENGTIIVTKKDNIVSIVFKEFVCWANNSENIVDIQQNLEDVKVDRIIIDFNDVVWMDNLILCHLFLYFEKAFDNNKKIDVYLLERDNIEHVRFINYMMEMGFVHFFEKINPGIVNETKEFLKNFGAEKLEDGNFNSAQTVMPYKIIKYEEEIDEVVSESIEMLYDLKRNTISFRLKLFLQEVLGNVFEHAYDENEAAYCGILIRRQTKRVDRAYKFREYNLESGLKGKIEFKQYQSYVFQNNAYRNKKFNAVRVDYIQVYVVDIGKGILSGINCESGTNDYEVLSKIFTSGERINRRNKNTQAGGLHMINNILKVTADGVGIRGDYNIFSIECEKNEFANVRPRGLYHEGYGQGDKIKGFSIVGYLNIYGDVTKEYRKYYKNPTQTDILDVYKVHNYKPIGSDTLIIDYRFYSRDKYILHDKVKNIIILVGRETSKNKLVKFFDDYLRDASKKVDNVIVADFVDQEISKYYMIFSQMKVQAKKVILISRAYSVAVFKYNTLTNRILHDQGMTKDYTENKLVNANLFTSIYKYIEWLINYESQLFWSFINEYQSKTFQKIYIKDYIKWNYGNEKHMTTYLDFSQASFIRECRELFILQVFRIISIYGTKIYFVSGDRFTEDICELANDELGTSVDSDHIYIGSAYVTGTSSLKQKAEPRELSNKWFYFFKHADYEGNCEVASLLEWDKWGASQIASITQSLNYERVEETPFIAPKGAEFFRDRLFKEMEKNKVSMSSKRMYEYLQEDNSWTNRISSFGHVDLIGPHDNIILNTAEMFKKDRLESYTQPKVLDTGYDFLLLNLYAAFGVVKEMKLEAAIENDIRQGLISTYATKEKIKAYSKLHKGFFENKEGILLYFTDYATTKIVGAFQEIFSDELNYKIIPMALINRERGAAALLASPLLLDSLQVLIDEHRKKYNDSLRVTIFSSMLISTKLIDELKHLIFRMGVLDVNVVSLVDRRRLSFGYAENENIKTLWKIDVPPLGTTKTCTICQGIENIEEMKEELGITNLKDRISKITSTWKCKKIFDSNLAVIEKRDIELPANIKEMIEIITEPYEFVKGIEIITDIGLVLFSIEDTAITRSLRLLENCLNSEVDDCTKILLLCAHLGLFKKVEISEKKRLDLLQKLYHYIKKQDVETEYSALALIIIAAQEKEILAGLKIVAKDDMKKNRNYSNVDGLISGIFINWFSEKNVDISMKYYFKSASSTLAEKLNAIFLYTCMRCRTTHSGVLCRLYDEGKVFQYEDYVEAYNRITYLKKVYQELPEDILSDSVESRDVLQQLYINVERVEKDLKQYLASPDDGWVTKIIKSNKLFIQSAEQLNNMLFKVSTDDKLQAELEAIRTGIIKKQREQKNREALENVLIEWPDKEDDATYWYFWTSDIISEIEYLMLDFRYISQKISYCMPDTCEMRDVTGIVEAEFKKDVLEIHFKNKIAPEASIEEIRTRKAIKYNRPTTLRIVQLSKRISKEELFKFDIIEIAGECILDACLKIPYIYVKQE